VLNGYKLFAWLACKQRMQIYKPHAAVATIIACCIVAQCVYLTACWSGMLYCVSSIPLHCTANLSLLPLLCFVQGQGEGKAPILNEQPWRGLCRWQGLCWQQGKGLRWPQQQGPGPGQG
jgi:hypothetical protein